MLGLHVPAEVHLPLEGPATPEAGEGFESRVFPAVGDQVRRLAEGLGAVAALVGLLAWRGEERRGYKYIIHVQY